MSKRLEPALNLGEVWSFGTIQMDSRAVRCFRSICSEKGIPANNNNLPLVLHHAIAPYNTVTGSVAEFFGEIADVAETLCLKNGSKKEAFAYLYQDWKEKEEVEDLLLRNVKRLLSLSAPKLAMSMLILEADRLEGIKNPHYIVDSIILSD